MPTALNHALAGVFTYIAGHTNIDYKIEKFDTRFDTENRLMFRATSNRVNVQNLRQPASLMMKTLWVIVSGECTASTLLTPGQLTDDFAEDTDSVDPAKLMLVDNQAGIGSLNCLFMFETPDGGQKNVTLNFSFRGGHIYHIS